jgi:hypothetical protein
MDRIATRYGSKWLSPSVSWQLKEHLTMANRRNTLLWMKDLIEHMSQCHDQLQWASDGSTQLFLAEALLGDLYECQKLCEQLRTSPGEANVAHSLAAH